MLEMMKDLIKLIFPHEGPLEDYSPKQITETDCKWVKDDRELILEYISNYQESENRRLKDVESKSAVFIGSFGVVGVILINMTASLITEYKGAFTIVHNLMIAAMLMTLVYVCCTIYCSIRALEKRNYNTLGFPKFLYDDSTEKEKKLVVKQYNCIKKNQKVINLKVDYMNLAHKYFIRVIFTIIVYCCLIFVNVLDIDLTSLISFVENTIKEFNPLYILLILQVICVIYIGYLANKCRKIEKIQNDYK